MRRIVRISLSVILTLTTPYLAHANGADLENKSAVDTMIRVFAEVKTYEGLMAKIKPALSPKDYAFLMKKVEPVLNVPLPTLVRKSEDEFYITQGQMSTSFKVSSARDSIYFLNHKKLDFSEMPSIPERFEMGKAAATVHDHAHLNFIIRLMEPRAEAVFPIVAVGIAYVAAHWGAIAGGALTLSLGIVGNSDWQCKEFKNAANACKSPIDQMTKLVEARKKQKKPKDACKTGSDEAEGAEELQKAALEARDGAKTINESIAGKGAFTCGDAKVAAEACVPLIEGLAKELCMKRVAASSTDINQKAQEALTIMKKGGQ